MEVFKNLDKISRKITNSSFVLRDENKSWKKKEENLELDYLRNSLYFFCWIFFNFLIWVKFHQDKKKAMRIKIIYWYF